MKNLSQHLNESFKPTNDNLSQEVILEGGGWAPSHYRLLATIDGIDVITQSGNSNNGIVGELNEDQLKEVSDVVKHAYKKLDKDLQKPYLEVFGHSATTISYQFKFWKFYLSNSFNSWQLGTTFERKEIEKIAKAFENAIIRKGSQKETITFDTDNGSFSYSDLKLNFSALG